jgi:hypothetical protein
MSKIIITLITISATALTVSACTKKATSLPPGTYEHSSSSTTPNGTKVEKETKTDVEVDRYGNKSATTTTKTSTDPEGLFNKSTSTSTTRTTN